MKKTIFIFFILIIFFGFSSEVKAAEASLFLSPSHGTFTVGSTFSVKVKVNSGGGGNNATEGYFLF